MWLTMSDAFLSIVAIPGDADNLKVRARRKGDIERVFARYESIITVERTPGRDYLYRAHIPREIVGAVVANHIEAISYDNFKNSVKDNRLHSACNRVWGVMADLQEIRPYARDTQRSSDLFDRAPSFPGRRRAVSKKPVVTE